MKHLKFILSAFLFLGCTIANAQYVDLGLSSGTLWATCNLGAEKEHESGLYLAWGETAEKQHYNINTYFDSDYIFFNNYRMSIRGTEYDAATTLKGKEWCMPTYLQAVELYNECSWEWVDDYNATGVAGCICTGPNGNSIFFPSAGVKIDGDLDYTQNGNYWCSELSQSWISIQNYACFINFDKTGTINSNYSLTSVDYRYWGRNVRPVINTDTAPKTEIGDFIFATTDNKHVLIAYTGNKAEVVLPADFKGENYSLGSNLFRFNDKITKVTIPNSVTSIGGRAFESCTALESINIPGSVKNIGFEAFKGCQSLKNFIFKGAPKMDQGVLSRTGLEEIAIPEGVENIPIYAFDNSPNLKRVIIPNSVTIIKGAAFENCQNLKKVKIGGNVELIANSAFAYCTNLKSITLPKELEYIGTGVFEGCINLKKITLPKELEYIGAEAFEGCINLKNITLPKKLKYIGDEAFGGCINLKNITLPKKLKYIGKGVFEGCTNLNNAILKTL